MKKKVLLAAVVVIVAVVLSVTARSAYMRTHPPEYHSEVDQSDCLLCGEPNLFRGADALLFIVVREDHWDADNVGMIQYCQKDSWGADCCIYEMCRDDSLSPEELAHKNAPFDVNGVLKRHDFGDFTATHYLNMFDDRHGVTGALNIYSKNGLIAGTLDIGKCRGANPDYLCTVLCQECFDKVYPITRRGNFFFADTLTGEVYQVCDSEEGRFDMRDYCMHVQLQDHWDLVFYVTYTKPEE